MPPWLRRLLLILLFLVAAVAFYLNNEHIIEKLRR